MKPRNFPERKNQRRKGALQRMADTPMEVGSKKAKEYATLLQRTVPSARDVRTKKDRRTS